MMETSNDTRGKEGMILFAVLAVISGLAIVASTMFTIASTNMRVAANFRDTAKAFFNADAAVQLTKSKIESGLAAGTLTLTNTSSAVSFAAPSGFSFDTITQIRRIGNGPAYGFTVTGRSSSAMAVINTTFIRRPAFSVGVFADSELDLKPNSLTYSYYSDITLNPTPSDSTGEADSGSNEQVITYNGTYMDGSLLLGADPFGNNATWSGHSGTVITGEDGVPVGRMDPDPLGAAPGGALAQTFTRVASSNNNSWASPAGVIEADRDVSLGNGDTMTLRSGNYYIDDIELKNGSTLQVVATNGAVNVYLTGNVDFKNGSTVNLTGKPADFIIYANKTGASLVIYNSSDFNGVIYAPFGSVDIKNSGNYRGVVWADSVETKNSGVIYVDLSIKNRLLSNKIQLTSWKEARN